MKKEPLRTQYQFIQSIMAAAKIRNEEWMIDSFRTRHSGQYAYLIPLVPTYLNVVSNWYATHTVLPVWMKEQDVIDAGFCEEDAKILHRFEFEFIWDLAL